MALLKNGDYLNSKNVDAFVEKVRKDGIRVVKLEWMGLDLILRNMATTVDFLSDAVRYGIGVTRAQ